MFQYVLSCTVMVQGGTRWYKVVQDGTRNSIWRYMEVHGSTRICKTVHTGMYWNILILTVQSGSSWIHCCHAALPKALYCRPVHLITVMQAQACFNQEVLGLPPPLPARHPRGGSATRRRSGGGRCAFRRRRARRRRSGVRVGSRYHNIVVVAVSAGSWVGRW